MPLLKKPLSNSLIILLFLIIGFTLYVNSFQNQLFWDDEDNILRNQYIKSWQYLPKYFSENLIAGAGLLSNYWRPLLLFVFSLEWQLWQDWPPGYHLVNTSFHIANAGLLFFILFWLFKNRGLALLTALVFLVHPLQTEAVTYVSGLGDPLSLFFIFLALLFYLKFRISQKTILESDSYFWSILMFILALMSKETAIILPALILIVDFFFLNQEEKEFSFKERVQKIGKAIWPFFILAGLYILLRATLLNFINTFNLYNEENIFTQNFHIRLFTFFRVLIVYFKLLLWPLNLHMERGVEIATSYFSLSVILGSLIFLGLLVLSATQIRRLPVLSFGILWFFIALSPTSNLAVPISGLLYEHWLYLPLIGIFLVLIWLGQLLAQKYHLQKFFLVIFLGSLIFFSVLTIDRNRDWQNPITFYNQTLKYAPNSYRVINNLGMAYAAQGDHQGAERMYQKAINLDPAQPVAYHNLANTYRATGKTELAIENFKVALSHDPEFLFSYNALVNLYLENKNYQEARRILEKYLNYTPSKVETLSLLAQIALSEKDFPAALDYLEKALTIDPQNQIIATMIINIKDLAR